MDYRTLKAIEQKNKSKLLDVNPSLDEGCGCYVLYRTDECGIKYTYIGQAKHILTRLAQHLVGYQYIDVSLKKHGLYKPSNIHGWKVGFVHCNEAELDDLEKKLIQSYAASGYQLRNKTAGGQGEGKVQIDEYRPQKGYRDGILQGKKSLARELAHIIDKHLVIKLKEEKQHNKVSQKALEKFFSLLWEGEKDGEN